jgi:hypothetical protein
MAATAAMRRKNHTTLTMAQRVRTMLRLSQWLVPMLVMLPSLQLQLHSLQRVLAYRSSFAELW